MEESKIVQHFEGKTILITGATGFLAKIFLEKILRIQPKIKKLFLLIRETPKRSSGQRLREEVLDTEVFRVLREECGEDFNSIVSSKVIPVSGDVASEDLGIVDSEMREKMWREIDIIVSSAATTRFEERYDVAFGVNTLGAMHVQDFATKCPKLEMFLHISTAYVHGTRTGLILEKPIHMGETLPEAKIPYVDINSEKKIIEEKLRLLQSQKLTQKEITIAMKEFGIERAMLHGWQNTYIFTKAMGEMLLENFKEKANVAIIRPTIITSTYKEPFPGWIEGVRNFDCIFVGYGKGEVRFFAGDPEIIHDAIPGDMVVNCMLAAIASHASDKNGLIVYHVGSSRRNPLKFGEIKWLMYRYLTENPMRDSRGKPIRVGEPTTLNSMASFQNYIAIRYMPLIKILKFINVIFCNYFGRFHANARRTVSRSMRLAELYEHYLFSQSIFDDANTENLRRKIRGNFNKNMGVLNFDPKSIRWDEYLTNAHFFGIVKYALNDS